MSKSVAVPTPIGNLLITASEYGLNSIKRTEAVTLMFDSSLEPYITQLQEYFAGTRKEFTLPMHTVGTPFQIKVWNALVEIPYGETRTYKQIAKEIGEPQAYRAVGTALKRNPLLIVVPCHRVVASSGLGGYSGGIDAKKTLLTLEGVKL